MLYVADRFWHILCTVVNYVCAYIDDSDVLYNKFNVDYITTGSLPMHPDDNYRCAVADKDWKVVRCSERKQVVCQKGQKLEI